MHAFTARDRKKNEALAARIFGKDRRSSAPFKTTPPPSSLASRAGVNKARRPLGASRIVSVPQLAANSGDSELHPRARPVTVLAISMANGHTTSMAPSPALSPRASPTRTSAPLATRARNGGLPRSLRPSSGLSSTAAPQRASSPVSPPPKPAMPPRLLAQG